MLDHQIKQENYELPQRQDFRILWGGGTKPLHGLITFQIPNLIFWVLPSMYWLSKFDFRTMGDWDQVGFIKRWRILSFWTDNSAIFEHEEWRFTQKICSQWGAAFRKHWASFKETESVEVNFGIRQWLCRRIESEENSWRDGENWWQCYGIN